MIFISLMPIGAHFEIAHLFSQVRWLEYLFGMSPEHDFFAFERQSRHKVKLVDEVS